PTGSNLNEIKIRYVVKVGLGEVEADQPKGEAPDLQAIAGNARSCYMDALVRNGAMTGKISLELVVDGSLVTVEIVKKNELDAQALACVRKAARTQSFPAS